MTDRPTVAAAMARADAAHAKIAGHEDLCAERFSSIHVGLNDLKKLVWGVILGGAGFAFVALFGVVLRAIKL